MTLDERVSDAILDLCLFADQQPGLPPQLLKHIERRRELRADIEDAPGLLDLRDDWDGDAEDEGE